MSNSMFEQRAAKKAAQKQQDEDFAFAQFFEARPDLDTTANRDVIKKYHLGTPIRVGGTLVDVIVGGELVQRVVGGEDTYPNEIPVMPQSIREAVENLGSALVVLDRRQIEEHQAEVRTNAEAREQETRVQLETAILALMDVVIPESSPLTPRERKEKLTSVELQKKEEATRLKTFTIPQLVQHLENMRNRKQWRNLGHDDLKHVAKSVATAPTTPPLPVDVTAADIKAMSATDLKALNRKHGSEAVTARLNGWDEADVERRIREGF